MNYFSIFMCWGIGSKGESSRGSKGEEIRVIKGERE